MANKFKIGIDARMYRRSTGGIGSYTHALLEYLSRIDKKNKYYVFLTDEDLKEYEIQAKNFIPVRAPYSHYSISEQLFFLRLLNSYHLDLVHFTNANFPILYRRKFVITIHDITMLIHPAFGKQSAFIPKMSYLLILKRAIAKAKNIIVDSKNTKKDLVQILKSPKGKISVVYLGVDQSYQPDSHSGQEGKLKTKYKIKKPYLLFVSQWRPHKGINNLVRSLEILNDRFKMTDLKLVITGKPNPKFREIERCIDSSVLRPRIITPGFVAEEDMASLYSNAAVFVFPSVYEGFGLNPLEAMACGIPVATSNVSCIPEVCGDAALYFDPFDPEDIALKTHTLLTHDKLRQKLITRGFANLKRFSWQKMAAETHRIYLDSLEN